MVNAHFFWLLGLGIVAIFLTFVLATVVQSYLKVRHLRRVSAELNRERLRLGRVCEHCGYDVRAAYKEGSSGLCPECGRPIGESGRVG